MRLQTPTTVEASRAWRRQWLEAHGYRLTMPVLGPGTDVFVADDADAKPCRRCGQSVESDCEPDGCEDPDCPELGR